MNIHLKNEKKNNIKNDSEHKKVHSLKFKKGGPQKKCDEEEKDISAINVCHEEVKMK